MFTGRYEPIPGSGELTQPSTIESMAATFNANFNQPLLLTPGMEQSKRKELSQRVATLKMESERAEGWKQKSLDWVAGMAGSILNPYALVTGGLAGIGFKAASPLITRGAGLVGSYLPSQATAFLTRPISEVLSHRVPEFISKESAASLTKKAASGFTQVTGFSLPGEIANTYDAKTDTFNWGQGIKASVEDGGVGLVLMSAPYMAGMIWGKFRKGINHDEMPLPGDSKKEFTEEHILEAVKNKKMTPEEGQWFIDYMFKKDTNENLSTRATEMLFKDGHPVDSATNKVLFKVLQPTDVDNFQTAVGDSMAASHMPQNVKSLYSDFIGKNSMDNLRENPKVIDGLQGVVSFVKKRLAKAPEEFVNFHKVMKRLLPDTLKEENPFTQAKMYRGEIKGRTGLTVPLQVEKRLKQEETIKRLTQKVKDYEREFARTAKPKYQKFIEKNNNRINELQSKLKPLLSHQEEMKYLRDKLLPEGNVAENFKATREYQRLLDLTKVRNDARRLLHEVNLKHEYEMHEAYATLLDTIAKVMRSEFGKLAKPDDVNDYMRERIESSNPQFKQAEIDAVKKEVHEAKVKMDKAQDEIRTPTDQDEAIEKLDQEVNRLESPKNKEEYDSIKIQMEEFKENETVFSNLIKCVEGTING